MKTERHNVYTAQAIIKKLTELEVEVAYQGQELKKKPQHKNLQGWDGINDALIMFREEIEKMVKRLGE